MKLGRGSVEHVAALVDTVDFEYPIAKSRGKERPCRTVPLVTGCEVEPRRPRPPGRLESRTNVNSPVALVASSVDPVVLGTVPRFGPGPPQLASLTTKKACREDASACVEKHKCAVRR